MKKSFLSKIKDILETQKRDILLLGKKEAETIDMDGDETDEIQGKILLTINNQLHARNLIKLKQIETALQRIIEGKYGFCQDCEEMIPEKRLLHNPYFQTCVGCSEERENKLTRKKA